MEVIFKPITIGNTFSSNYIEYEKKNGDEDKTLSIKECLVELRPYLSSTIIDFKAQGEWKI